MRTCDTTDGGGGNKQAARETRGEFYLWGNDFDKFVEKAELANFTVKPFPAVFHTRLQNLGNNYNARTENRSYVLARNPTSNHGLTYSNQHSSLCYIRLHS